jgi:hypothetical protein
LQANDNLPAKKSGLAPVDLDGVFVCQKSRECGMEFFRGLRVKAIFTADPVETPPLTPPQT